MSSDRGGGKLLETADSRAAAEAAESRWAAEITRLGLAGVWGARIRTVRLGPRNWCWGIYMERHDSNGGKLK